MDISGKSSRSVQSPATPAKVSRNLLLATDLQQSILAELDQSGPNRRAYSAYGVPSSQRPPGSRLGFNGQISERPTGWYHLGNGHRVYNPVLMRFHSPDRLSPFGKGGINAYAYCGGSPVGRVDPSGQSLVNLIGQSISTIISPVFIAANYGKTWLAIANGQTLSTAARVSNTSGFYGGVLGAVFRPLGFPAAIASTAPGIIHATSVVGSSAGQVSTFISGSIASYLSFRAALSKVSASGQVLESLGASLQEVSGVNLVLGKPFPKLRPVPEIPLESVHVMPSQQIGNTAAAIRM